MRWKLIPEKNPIIINTLAKELGVDRTMAKLLVNRDIQTFDEVTSHASRHLLVL